MPCAVPGAFTPTCTDDHLPGLIRSAPALADLNVNKIVVVTANDNYVNTAWSESVCSCLSLTPDQMPIEFAADPVGELLESLGMIAFLGKGLGVRSKRFALIAEDGVAVHVAIDEGSEELHETSADALLPVVEGFERQARAAAAEAVAAAEIYKMAPSEALAYLKAESDALLAAGMDAAELEEAIDIVAAAAASSAAAAASAETGGAVGVGVALAALAIGAGAYFVYGPEGGDLSKLSGIGLDLASMQVDPASLGAGLASVGAAQ